MKRSNRDTSLDSGQYIGARVKPEMKSKLQAIAKEQNTSLQGLFDSFFELITGEETAQKLLVELNDIRNTITTFEKMIARGNELVDREERAYNALRETYESLGIRNALLRGAIKAVEAKREAVKAAN